jgi:hypothetical protein
MLPAEIIGNLGNCLVIAKIANGYKV